ncbi:hypothetical protein SAMN05216345_108178 [Cupriavidus sp. YR651]|uniref:hypothetical protein n=1 Tax=Cupriavidus sp. YR651 TaxID=1855315 RepID=UPI00087F3366|nr:hypothetical protein [Cupriavidus sp. YR651]SDD38003.1 hypothetical protein SAMN05216345_108178 [Cupriavidus sp. YR651]
MSLTSPPSLPSVSPASSQKIPEPLEERPRTFAFPRAPVISSTNKRFESQGAVLVFPRDPALQGILEKRRELTTPGETAPQHLAHRPAATRDLPVHTGNQTATQSTLKSTLQSAVPPSVTPEGDAASAGRTHSAFSFVARIVRVFQPQRWLAAISSAASQLVSTIRQHLGHSVPVPYHLLVEEAPTTPSTLVGDLEATLVDVLNKTLKPEKTDAAIERARSYAKAGALDDFYNLHNQMVMNANKLPHSGVLRSAATALFLLQTARKDVSWLTPAHIDTATELYSRRIPFSASRSVAFSQLATQLPAGLLEAMSWQETRLLMKGIGQTLVDVKTLCRSMTEARKFAMACAGPETRV